MLEQIPALIKSATPKVAFAVFITTATVLFAPPEFVSDIGLLDARITYTTYIGLAFLASGALTLINVIQMLASPLTKILYKMRRERNIEKIVDDLTFQEKAALFPFMMMLRNTVYFPLDDGISNGLVAQGLLYRASNLSRPGFGSAFAYNMQPLARKVLTGKGPSFFDDISECTGNDFSRLREIVPVNL